MLFLLIEGTDCDGGHVQDFYAFEGDGALGAAWERWGEWCETADAVACPTVFDTTGRTYDRAGKTHHRPDQDLADMAEGYLEGGCS